MVPKGLRVDAHALTTRGLVEEDFARVGEFLGEAVDDAAEIQKTSGPKMSEFRKVVKDSPRSA